MSIGTRENPPITGNRDPKEGCSRQRKFFKYHYLTLRVSANQVGGQGPMLEWECVFCDTGSGFTLYAEQSRSYCK
jgi:hypothetical protein